MRKLDFGDRYYTEGDVFVIAELGCNHMGQAHTCRQMIEEAARCGADAVKLQKRDNRELFTKTAYGRDYRNELSYGPTYGAHREALEFGREEYEEFKQLAHDRGLRFIVTPFDLPSLAFCQDLGVDAYKLASSDVTNTPLARRVAAAGRPVFASTGGAEPADIRRLAQALDQETDNWAILHCVSRYPNRDEDLDLATIHTLKTMFPQRMVGFSSHHPGLLPCLLARHNGASVFEVHFTLNRGERGTDHGFSLEPRGLSTLCEDLRRVQKMEGFPVHAVTEEERNGFPAKHGKGIYLKLQRPAGHVIQPEDLVVKAPYEGGFYPYEEERVVGRELVVDCATGVNIGKGHVK